MIQGDLEYIEARKVRADPFINVTSISDADRRDLPLPSCFAILDLRMVMGTNPSGARLGATGIRRARELMLRAGPGKCVAAGRMSCPRSTADAGRRSRIRSVVVAT